MKYITPALSDLFFNHEKPNFDSFIFQQDPNEPIDYDDEELLENLDADAEAFLQECESAFDVNLTFSEKDLRKNFLKRI